MQFKLQLIVMAEDGREERVSDIGECQVACVNVLVPSPPIGTRPSNILANWFITLLQSRTGIVQRLLMLRSAKYNSLKTASSLGNSARFLMILRNVMFSDSIVFVV